MAKLKVGLDSIEDSQHGVVNRHSIKSPNDYRNVHSHT